MCHQKDASDDRLRHGAAENGVGFGSGRARLNQVWARVATRVGLGATGVELPPTSVLMGRLRTTARFSSSEFRGGAGARRPVGIRQSARPFCGQHTKNASAQAHPLKRIKRAARFGRFVKPKASTNGSSAGCRGNHVNVPSGAASLQGNNMHASCRIRPPETFGGPVLNMGVPLGRVEAQGACPWLRHHQPILCLNRPCRQGHS